MQQVVDDVADTGEGITVARVGLIIGEYDTVRLVVVFARHPQYHDLARAGLQQDDFVLVPQLVEAGQPLGELDDQLHGEYRDLGYLPEPLLARVLVRHRRILQVQCILVYRYTNLTTAEIYRYIDYKLTVILLTSSSLGCSYSSWK